MRKKFVFLSFILAVTIAALHIFYFSFTFLDSHANISHAADGFFLPENVRPEPFKIPLYLLVMSSIAAGSILGRKRIQKFLDSLIKNKKIISFAPIVFTALFMYFVWLLGTYPLFEWNQVALPKTLLTFVYSCVWLAIIFLLPKFLERFKLNSTIENCIIIALLIFFTYIPTFPVSLFDYSYLIGPAHAVASGQTLYSQAPSQYGFGSILLFALAEKIFPGVLLNLGVFIWALYIIEVFVLYVFVRKFSGSARAGLLALATSVTLSFFSLLSTPFGIPQVGAFRWLQFLLTFLLLIYVDDRTEKLSRRMLVLFLIAFLSLLVVDVGIAIDIAVFLYWGLQFLARKISFWRCVQSGLLYLGGLFLSFCVLNTFSLFLSGKIIGVQLIFHTVSQYSQHGYGFLPLAFHTFFWLFFLTIIASFFVYTLQKKETLWTRAVLLSALLFMTGSMYMLGRSHPHNLFNISRLWVLNLFVLLTPLIKKIETGKHARKNLFYVSVVVVLIFIPSFFRQQNMVHLFREKIGRLPYAVPALSNKFPAKIQTNFAVDYERDLRSLPTTYKEEVQLLQETFPTPNQPIAIFALNSTYFYYLSQRPSLLWSDPLDMILQTEEVSHALLPIKKNGCPPVIAYDPLCIDRTTCHRPPNDGILVAQDQVYKAFVKMCGNYKPFRCAGELCAARRNSSS